MKLLQFSLLISLLFYSFAAFSQNNSYPKVVGYVGIVHPLVTFTAAETTTNFKSNYVVGMPTGINLWKTKNIGFSMEFIPYLKAENGTTKMSNFLFHPGILVPLGQGFTFAGRAAFETSGRYGITPVLNKTVIKNKNSSYYIALPLPIRFGNNLPSSFTIGFQFGISF